MVDLGRVGELFALFSDLPEGQLERWGGLCQAGAAQLVGMLKDGVNPETHKERLATTAAALAYADYLLLGQTGVSSSDQIKVGDISLGANSQVGVRQDSLSIRQYFLEQIGDLILPAVGIYAIKPEGRRVP